MGKAGASKPNKPRKKARAEPEPLKNKRGRPFAIKAEDVDKVTEELQKLGVIRCTTKECAAFLGIVETTLFALFERYPQTKDAYESGKELGKISQRRDLLALGKTNGAVAIFNAMNELGMKDKRFLEMKGVLKELRNRQESIAALEAKMAGQVSDRPQRPIEIIGGLPHRANDVVKPADPAPGPAKPAQEPGAVKLKVVGADGK